jgi:hypothetical protein
MPQPKPSAASQIWPHLAQGTPNEVAQSKRNSLGDALWPQLSREAKQREAAQARWDEWRKRDRESLLRHLRELNARIDARLARERRG